jgi:hypothetical protein
MRVRRRARFQTETLLTILVRFNEIFIIFSAT